MIEYIVAIADDRDDFEEMFIGHIRRQNELIHCRDCRFYHRISPDSLLALTVKDHPAICTHPNGCLETEPGGFCHYAQRRTGK